MHEQGIARDLVNRAVEAATSQGTGQVTCLNIRLGPMGLAGKDSLAAAIRQASQGTIADGATVRVAETSHGGIVLESIELQDVY